MKVAYGDFPIKKANRMSLAFRRGVCGVGTNDAPYIIKLFANGVRVECPIYQIWRAMLFRCYNAGCQEKQPTYIGCTVVDEWLSFMAFRAWVLAQPEWEGLQLDKDLLIPGNKVYGPDTCIFVSQEINLLLISNLAKPSGYPTGVYWEKLRGRKKYTAQCRERGRRSPTNLGHYYTPKGEKS